ncbi:hypothetical protein EYC98_01345 [Halieaceae bacterium IMCC14734]|uniref:Rubredoxin-like domain-containing protein n=1 Tax=Candidatus Litorirhabdus singularis TaxID=2518993 RepID=A0ABT3TBD8_9GAMM|nr:hypothetical protein [Candidatus Litorirhabdus singularis]MCX2979500.1 hypothetical protein [Candidatus Litorirhabdus singularis]
MAYYCYDCSFRGKKRGKNGHCPACDSPNFRAEKADKQEEKNKNPAWRLVLLVALWAYLIGHIAWKLNN